MVRRSERSKVIGLEELVKLTTTATEKVVGINSGKRKRGRYTCWWNEKVKEALKYNKYAFKTWSQNEDAECKETYKECTKICKRLIAIAKAEAIQ